ncbi:unnamed protein product [Ceratitis capitata]|uniref:(Mediterranean fruit fly) hypothetical protein n=1 Tax=Ceratitis capitata TaxID=7213 RepID=A0A811UBX9_CERCA|nr:unnamed protein product [Ceratitis capitata]
MSQQKSPIDGVYNAIATLHCLESFDGQQYIVAPYSPNHRRQFTSSLERIRCRERTLQRPNSKHSGQQVKANSYTRPEKWSDHKYICRKRFSAVIRTVNDSNCINYRIYSSACAHTNIASNRIVVKENVNSNAEMPCKLQMPYQQRVLAGRAKSVRGTCGRKACEPMKMSALKGRAEIDYAMRVAPTVCQYELHADCLWFAYVCQCVETQSYKVDAAGTGWSAVEMRMTSKRRR